MHKCITLFDGNIIYNIINKIIITLVRINLTSVVALWV
jgi:hypothetical protein